MLARLAAPGLRASLRTPLTMRSPSLPSKRMSSTSSSTKQADGVRRGFDEVVPFLKRIPVDVYPLVGMLSFVCVLGVFFSTKNLMTDKTLRLKPNGAVEEE